MITGLLGLAVVITQAPVPPAQSEQRPALAAVVDGERISSHEVERELTIALPHRTIAPEERPVLLANMLEQLIARRLILRWLVESKQSASEADIAFSLEQLKASLARRKVPLEEYLRQQQLDEAGLRKALAWQLGWGRFLDRYQSDVHLEKYFREHRRDFDGTELRVAHILFRVESPDTPESTRAARDRARKLLAEIRAGKVSFADAARQFSDGPSRDQGGDIGWIGRREPMPESFTLPAFALEPLQVSEPIATTFGIHLIQCLEIRPGQRRWQEMRAELEQAMSRYLFEWAAIQIRPRAKIEYSPGFPHFRPGTEVLAK